VDDLRELLRADAAYQVSPDTEMAAMFVVVYDELVARTYEQLVAASARALECVPGVLEVIHEDRDVVLIRASPDLRIEELTAALRTFWDRSVTLSGVSSAPASPSRRPRCRWLRALGR
jgi:hypothetical protein